jgi:hypothetical protein
MRGPIGSDFHKVQSIHKTLIYAQLDYWQNHIVFTDLWWLLVVLCVVAWAVWVKTVDKRHLPQIALFGAFVLIVTTTLDGLGSETLMWDYPVQVTPHFTRFIPVDFVAMPLTYMWLYQGCKTWRSFIIASVVMSLTFSFLLEPLAAWIGIYDPIHWRHIYSFPIYVAIALCLRWTVEAIFRERPVRHHHRHAEPRD